MVGAAKLIVHKPTDFKQVLSIIEDFQSSTPESWYRGVTMEAHALLPALYRHKKIKTAEKLLELEGRIIRSFAQRSIPFTDNIQAGPWDQIFYMQHFGVPNEALIHELFVRLNRSKPLTGAEIRNAVVGPVSKIIKNISNHEFFQENIRFTVTRGEDLNTAGKILLFEYKGELVGTKKKDLDEFAKDKTVNSKNLELAGLRSFEILSDMKEVFLPRDSLLSSSGMTPVYYWFVREMEAKRYHLVREFLHKFEEARKLHREAQKEHAGVELIPLLARFDTLNRSTNDPGSHTGRVEILQKAFKRWTKQRHAKDALAIFRG